MVDNHPQRAITYTKMQTTKSTEMYEIAKALSVLIEKDIKGITKSDLQDYWLMKYPDEANDLITDKERDKINNNEELETTEKNRAINQLTRSKITEEQLNSFNHEELEIIAIYREMASGYALSPQIIKGEISQQQMILQKKLQGKCFSRRICSSFREIRGIKGVNTTTDWRRVKTSSLAILGTTTLPKEGIPKDRLDYFLSRDYSQK